MGDPRDPMFRVFRVGEGSDAVVPVSPIRYEMRLSLEPVGENWNSSITPIYAMTYDPPKGGATNGN